VQRTHHRLSDAPFTRQSFLVAEQSRAGETTVKPHASKNEGGPAVFRPPRVGRGMYQTKDSQHPRTTRPPSPIPDKERRRCARRLHSPCSSIDRHVWQRQVWQFLPQRRNISQL